MPSRLCASGARVMLKLRLPRFQARPPKAEAPLPSSQVSIWRPETTGTPRAWAEATIWGAAIEPFQGGPLSECMLAVKAP